MKYRVTFIETFDVEADSEAEAQATAEEMSSFVTPDTSDTQVEEIA